VATLLLGVVLPRLLFSKPRPPALAPSSVSSLSQRERFPGRPPSCWLDRTTDAAPPPSGPIVDALVAPSGRVQLTSSLDHIHELVSSFSRLSCVQLTKSFVSTAVGVVQHAQIRSIDRSLLLRRCREGVHSAAAEGSRTGGSEDVTEDGVGWFFVFL
jgi:hypothetical protein